jgi:hypothetical protein
MALAWRQSSAVSCIVLLFDCRRGWGGDVFGSTARAMAAAIHAAALTPLDSALARTSASALMGNLSEIGRPLVSGRAIRIPYTVRSPVAVHRIRQEPSIPLATSRNEPRPGTGNCPSDAPFLRVLLGLLLVPEVSLSVYGMGGRVRTGSITHRCADWRTRWGAPDPLPPPRCDKCHLTMHPGTAILVTRPPVRGGGG